jgi:oxygen-independent coproporphyrinogen-3 oxidase
LTAESVRSLYLHIPFCESRCPYCDFAIRVGGEELHSAYVEALVRELDWLGSGIRPGVGMDTVYLGGGTPGLLPPALLGRLLEAVDQRLGISRVAEVTIEANPSGLTEGLVRRWTALGINRLSLGVQSLNDRSLRWLGRNHDRADAEAALRAVRRSGLENLSCDLIYAIPGETGREFELGLRELLCYQPQHLSCYELTVEPSTPLARWVASGRVAGTSEQDFLEQHRLAREVLGGAGLPQYEVSNYARPGWQSRHNLVYWRGQHYLAAGCGAHGFLDSASAQRLGLEVAPGAGVRYWNHRNATTYVGSVAARGNGVRGQEVVSSEQHELERLSCGLRLREGVDLSRSSQLTQAHQLVELGLLTLTGPRAVATPKGEEVLDSLALELAAPEPVAAGN